MSSNSETGHARNVANLISLKSFCESRGEEYNPSNSYLSLESLSNIAGNGQKAVAEVNMQEQAARLVIKERTAAFAPLTKLVSRAVEMLKASGAKSSTIDAARTIRNKITGTRARKKNHTAENSISTSQMSFDMRLDNFDKFIKLLSMVPEYKPKIDILTVASLSTLYNTLREKNMAVVKALIPLSQARAARDSILYADMSGLIDVASAVKAYIKALYGKYSPEAKQVMALQFKNRIYV